MLIKKNLPRKLSQFKIGGFTLIEVMVVVVILGILASLIIPRIISRPEEAKILKAKADILSIETALDLYRLDNGFYPSTEQGLAALVNPPTTEPLPHNWKAEGYLKQIPIDPWGNPYHYQSPGEFEVIDIFTYGPENKPSSKGMISNARKTQVN